MSLALLTLPFLALGFIVGRPISLVVSPLAWSAYFAGLATGWWGSGLGDGWLWALAALAAAGMAAAGVGVTIRHAVARARGKAS